jgi:quercetin dioxygenase-like cupin family protein
MEINAAEALIVPRQPKTVMVMGELITFRVTGNDTQGRYAVLESVTQPGSGVPMLHTHPEQETFYVLEGTYEIYERGPEGKRTIKATPGATVHIPAGAPHAFRNVGEMPGRLLMILEPAGNMDRFFEEIGLPVVDQANPPAPEGPPDMDALIQVMEKYGLRFLEPLPA